jgi:hypothetical protein
MAQGWSSLLFLAPLFIAACHGPPSRAVPPPPRLHVSAAAAPGCADPAGAFTGLSALVGDWEATTASGKTLRVSYRLVSADSALVETFNVGSGRETLTIFHLDGARVLATHYCAQKNQPRLALTAQPDPKHFTFSFVDATNLPDPNASHLTRLEIALVDDAHFEKTEIYEDEGKPERTAFAFHRAPKP